jgi:hypothetical protein
MAKKQLPVEPEQTALATTDSEVPAFLRRGDTTGTENITRDDIRIPRLCIAQGLSPQLQPEAPEYIAGLKFGDAYNDLTGEIYGRDPIKVVVVRSDRPRYVHFKPRSEGGGVIDGNVSADDPRTQFTVDADGKRVNPIATKFYDYVILLGDAPDNFQPMALSFKSSGIRSAVRLNGLIKMKPYPIYSSFYELRPTIRKDGERTWYIFSVTPAGFIQDEVTFNFAMDAALAWSEKQVPFDVTPADTDEPGAHDDAPDPAVAAEV